ncbi:MAG: hypothetical protein M1818_002795 [Claussenomyces sp. TS43310]|nr:MAG: hypothetical protein M1818_002795 [Claussenomyces sp. TS43310]
MLTPNSLTVFSLLFLTYGAHVNGLPGHDRYHQALHRAPRDLRQSYQRDGTALASAAVPTGIFNASSLNGNYTWINEWKTKGAAAGSVASVTLVPNSTTVVQGLPIITTVPLYEICDPLLTNCSTVFEAQTTTICSAVLTGFFARVTVSECDQNVTFSTKSGFQLATTLAPATATGALAARQDQSTTMYVQSVVSYYVAPWQSIAANTPTGITVVVCTFSITGVETCSQINEVWAVHTAYVPVTMTSAVSIAAYFPSAVLLVLGGGQSLAVTPGTLELQTVVTMTTLSANETTSTIQAPITTLPYPTQTSAQIAVLQASADSAPPLEDLTYYTIRSTMTQTLHGPIHTVTVSRARATSLMFLTNSTRIRNSTLALW